MTDYPPEALDAFCGTYMANAPRAVRGSLLRSQFAAALDAAAPHIRAEAAAAERERLRVFLKSYVVAVIHSRTPDGDSIYASGPIAFPDALIDTFTLMTATDPDGMPAGWAAMHEDLAHADTATPEMPYTDGELTAAADALASEDDLDCETEEERRDRYECCRTLSEYALDAAAPLIAERAAKAERERIIAMLRQDASLWAASDTPRILLNQIADLLAGDS